MKVYVTYCSRTKNDVKEGTPVELYKSQRIQSFFRRFPKPRWILSYKYGVIPENLSIDNYEQDGFLDIEKCANNLARMLRGFEVIFYSPRELVEKPWIRLLEMAKINYKIVRSYRDLNLPGKLDEFLP